MSTTIFTDIMRCRRFHICMQKELLVRSRWPRSQFIKLSKRYESISCFCESLNKGSTYSKPPRLSVSLYFYIFVCFTQFTLFVYKSSLMVAENFQRYLWIQHSNTQPVVITRKWNKLLWTSEASESPFNWHIHFICIAIFNICRRKFPKIPLDST